MKHLKLYEELDIEKYKSFIKKYKKTDYISKRTIKTMKELGIKDAFSRIKKGVNDAYKIFNKQDKSLLEDLFLYVEDDFNAKIVYNWCSIKVEPDFPLNDFTIVASHDGTLPSKNGDKLDDEINIVDSIIRNIDSVADDKRRELKEKRDRSDSWYKWQISRMVGKDIYDNVKISPIISLQLQLDFNDSFHDYGDEEYERIAKEKREKLYKLRSELKTFLKEDIFDRYLKAIGINNDFDITEISDRSYYNVSSNTTYEIKLKL